MELKIYDKNDVYLASIKEYSFTSEHMGEDKVSSVFYSPEKINISVGSYVNFRNKKYSIFHKPRLTKTSNTNINVGNALKYELEFFAPYKVFETINFEDYVSKDDTQQYYTGTPVFYFFNNVTELAIRLQANLDRFLGAGVWSISVSGDVVMEEKQVSVSNINLWDGLKLTNSIFGLDFYINGTDITIGGSGYEIPTTFYYGKGNGLYEISRIFEYESKIITRLKAYGSGRNLPHDYLRDENGKGRYFTQLMLPNFATTGIDYVDAPAELIEEYGIREGANIFEDVYPSIEEIDLGQGRIDEIIKVDPIDVDSDYFTIHTRDLGFEISNYWTAETPRLSIKGSNSDGSPTYLGGYEFEIIQDETSGTTFKLLKNQSENKILPDDVTTVRAGDRFVLLGIEMPQSYITNAENKLAIRAAEYMQNTASENLSYPIKVDEKFINEQGLDGFIIAGNKVKIEDDDLNVANYIAIQNLTIKYGGILPNYDIKLSNVPSKTLKSEFEKTKINQTNVNTVINNSTNFTRISNNLKIDQVGGELTWQ